MSENPTTTERQARVARSQHEERHPEAVPSWRTDPKTATERQAASLLGPSEDRDGDR